MHNIIIMAMYHTIEFRDFVWIKLNFPKLKTTSGNVNINTYYLECICVFTTNYLGILISDTVASYAPKTDHDEPFSTKVSSQ